MKNDNGGQTVSGQLAEPVLASRTGKLARNLDVTTKRFVTLDGMRGVAAILVVFFHLGQRPGGLQFPGYLAVDLFFALSGFVIAMSYTNRFDSGLGVGRFFEMRLIRLFPLHAMGTILGLFRQVLLGAFHGNGAMRPSVLAAAFAFNFFMIPDLLAANLFPLNGPSWSLFFEIGINVCFAAYLWKAPTWLITVIMALSMLGLCIAISAPAYFSVGWSWKTFHLGIFRTSYSFLAGVLISRHVASDHRKESWWSLTTILLMVVVIAYTAPGDARAYAEALIVSILFPLLIIAAIRFESPKILAQPFGFLGDLSYPIYAIHWPLIGITYAVFKKLHFNPLTSTVIFFIILLPVAYAAAKIDQLCRTMLSRWASLRRTASLQSI